MLINHFNTFVDGGAAVAALRLHESLRASGVESRFWHARPRDGSVPERAIFPIDFCSAESGITPVASPVRSLKSAVKKLLLMYEENRSLWGRPAGLEIFSSARRAQHTPCPAELLQGDLLQLHWVARAIDVRDFFTSIPDDYPIVWTLHDMNPFTGGCHYAGGCSAFTSLCCNCPQLGKRGQQDLSSRTFSAKLESLARKNMHVVAPSRWLLQEAQRSRVFEQARGFYFIPYGLDAQRFAPKDKAAARKQLRLPEEKVVIAFGAADIQNRRKGMIHLLSALSLLDNKSRYLALLFGGGSLPKYHRTLPECREVGFISNAETQALLYSAADLVVVPSLEDNSPQTGLEAMACGTPVVGFRAGGIPDYVVPNETGLLADVGDEVDLARQIAWLADHPQQRRRMGQSAYRLIRDSMQYAQQAAKYIRLYREITTSGNPIRIAV